MAKLSYLQDEDERLYPLDEEEDEDGLPRQGTLPQSVPPQLRRVIGLDQPTHPPGNPAEVQRAIDADARVVDTIKAKPERAPAKWWQKLAAAGLGAAAGYSNASGRGRPIDVSGATQEILAPGYKRKLDDWRGKVNEAGAEREVANQGRDAWWKNRKMQSEEDLQAAQADLARKHGDYWENRSEMEQNQWKVNSKGQLYNTVTGEIKNPAPTLKDRMKEAQEAGLSEEEAKVYAIGGKLGEPKPERTRNPINVAPGHTVIDPDTGKPIYTAPGRPDREPGDRSMTPGQKAMIERRKNDALMKGERMAKLRVKGDPVKGIEPEDPASVYAEWEEEKQRIQNAYEGEIAAATGGDPGHFDYPEQAPKAKAEPPKSTGGRGGPKPTAQAANNPQEGTVIRNPKTGERMVLKNGQWQPL